MTTNTPAAEQDGISQETIRLCAHVTATETDEALVLLDGRKGHYWQLNATGALILRALLAGMPAPQVAYRIATTQPVTEERAAHDIEELITSLNRAKLVERVGTA